MRYMRSEMTNRKPAQVRCETKSYQHTRESNQPPRVIISISDRYECLPGFKTCTIPSRHYQRDVNGLKRSASVRHSCYLFEPEKPKKTKDAATWKFHLHIYLYFHGSRCMKIFKSVHQYLQVDASNFFSQCIKNCWNGASKIWSIKFFGSRCMKN